LLQAAAQLARAHGVVRLDLATAVDNLAAQKTYEGLGWERNTAFFRYQLML
jgi:ribosomal protein S18 acetylase RimI-like enzyme